VNHRKKPGGDGDSSIRDQMTYATEQFVKDEIKKSEQATKEFVKEFVS